MINDILVFPRIYTNFRANVNQGVTKTNVSPLLAQTAALEQREIHRANNQKKKKKKRKKEKLEQVRGRKHIYQTTLMLFLKSVTWTFITAVSQPSQNYKVASKDIRNEHKI